jgi:hypothetical protein
MQGFPATSNFFDARSYMTPDPSNPLQQVYDFFKHLYPASSPESFFAFEQLGFPIDPADFQIDGAACPPLGIEWLSGLANKAFVFQNSMVQHSSLTVDGLVGLMLNASMPNSTDDMPTLGATKLAAGSKFDITLQSLSGIANDDFHPVVASPINWYQPDQAGNWRSYPLGQPPPTTTAPPPITPSPSAPQPPGRLPTQLLHWSVPAASVQPIARVPAAVPRAPLVNQVEPSLSIRATLTPARMAMMARPSPSAVAVSAFQQHPSMPAITEQNRISLVREAPVRMLQLHTTLQNAATASATAAAQPVSGSDIYVSFDYCVVSLEWPWIDEAFLLLRNWFIPGYTQAAISDGSGLTDAGLLPALPTGFILIRKLTIKANWAQSDIDAIQVSAGLGPFSLAGRNFNPKTGLLTADGMQIVGWFCSALPQLPPCADPHLAVAPKPVASTAPVDTAAQPVS